MVQWFQHFGTHLYSDLGCSLWIWPPLRRSESFVFRRFGLNITSKVVRYAVILLGSLRMVSSRNIFRELELRDKFYNHAIKAIENNCSADILYASYAMCYTQGLSNLEEQPKHFFGFLTAYQKLITSSCSNEIVELKGLYRNLLWLSVNWLSAFDRKLHRRRHASDKTVLALLAHGNIAEFISLTTRTVELGDSNGQCVQTAGIRLELLHMLLDHEATQQFLKVESYHERSLVIQAAKNHLQSLRLIFRSSSWLSALQTLQLMGAPPFNDWDRLHAFTNARVDERLMWPSIWRSCLFYLLDYMLFDGAPTDTFEFTPAEAALTICRLVAISTSIRDYAPYIGHVLRSRALFLAGLVLSELHLQDGISSYLPADLAVNCWIRCKLIGLAMRSGLSRLRKIDDDLIVFYDFVCLRSTSQSFRTSRVGNIDLIYCMKSILDRPCYW